MNTRDTLLKTLAARLGVGVGVGAAAGAGLAAWGVSQLTDFRLHQYTLPLLEPGTLRGAPEFRILHLSDLHMIPGQEQKIAWVSALDTLHPDLVINTGDNLSDEHAVPDVLAALGPLLARPGMFVFGTNDYWAPKVSNPLTYLTGAKRTPSYVDLPWQGMRAAFIERGWRDATHKRLEFQAGPVRLAAAGVDDPHHDLDDYSTIAGPPNADADLSLALLHAPYPRVLDRFAADGYQLAFAGHTHGGQICLPGGRALTTNSGIEPARAAGLHKHGAMNLHVSNGLGTSKFAPIRLWCPPSATLLKITEQT